MSYLGDQALLSAEPESFGPLIRREPNQRKKDREPSMDVATPIDSAKTDKDSQLKSLESFGLTEKDILVLANESKPDPVLVPRSKPVNEESTTWPSAVRNTSPSAGSARDRLEHEAAWTDTGVAPLRASKGASPEMRKEITAERDREERENVARRNEVQAHCKHLLAAITDEDEEQADSDVRQDRIRAHGKDFLGSSSDEEQEEANSGTHVDDHHSSSRQHPQLFASLTPKKSPSHPLHWRTHG